jgi:TolB-like protein/Tfp pilus assembly protein PilF
MTAKMIGSIGSHSRAAAFLVVALAAAIAGVVYFNSGNKAIQSIAVLPFVNEGRNPETEYLADGITETLINDLTRLPNLTVRPRNSVFGYQARHKDRELDVRAAGRELNVEAALVGRFAPRGDRIVISLELIDVRDNRLLWGARRERPMSDLLALQADIAREVSEHLRTRLSPEDRRQLAKRYTDNIDAYRAYLRGREAWNRRSREGFAKAIQFYDEAIAIDPKYALAWSGLADCHISAVTYGMLPPGEGFAKAKQAARRALAIDDRLAQAHTSLAHISWLHEWDWAVAERGFKRAIELDPNYPVARQWHAIYLSSMARHNEAIEEIGRAQTLDPLSGIIALDAARTLYFARQYDRAIEQYHKAVELAPGLRTLNSWLRMSYEQKELYDRAVEEHLKTLSERGATPGTLASFKAAYASTGWQGHWRKQLELSNEELRKRPVSPYFMAEIHARLGDKEQTLEWLEKAYEKHSDYLVRLKVDPLFDGLRSEPRFESLLRRIGLAQ